MCGRSTRSLDIIATHMRPLSKRVRLIILAIVLIALSLYFFMWTIQTAWLGSFPGHDIDKYTLWAFLQLAAAMACAGGAAIAVLRSRRSRGTTKVGAK